MEFEKLIKFGYIITKKSLFDFQDKNGESLFTIFPDDKYIQFHGGFTQIGIDLPGIKDILSEGNWSHNHT